MSNDIRTKAIVLRRTNYGESDRILTIATENGTVSVLARGVRKEKSKLAGGIEMFCLSDIVYHEGKNNKLGILTGAKIIESYQNIITDLSKIELGSRILRAVYRASESISGPEYFNLVRQSIAALNQKTNPNMIEAWFLLNLAKINGEEVNLMYDVRGEKLVPTTTYVWDPIENALRSQIGGDIGPNEIKLMRLMTTSDLEVVARVRDADNRWLSILHLAKSTNKL